MAKDLIFKIKGNNKQFKESLAESKSAASSLGSYLQSGFGIGAGVLGISSAAGMVKDVIGSAFEASMNREKQIARLKATFAGDSDAAKEAMDGLINLADKGGVKVDDLVNSFTDLQAKGFDPTMASMQQIGDLAAYFGNDMTTMGEQIEKASLGNLRAFKSMGIELEHIKNKKSGINDLKLTFHGVTTEINDSAEAIKQYLLGLDDVVGVKGSMEALGDTASGSINKMKNAWDEFMISLSSSDGPFKSVVDGITSMLNDLSGAKDTRKEEENKKLIGKDEDKKTVAGFLKEMWDITFGGKTAQESREKTEPKKILADRALIDENKIFDLFKDSKNNLLDIERGELFEIKKLQDEGLYKAVAPFIKHFDELKKEFLKKNKPNTAVVAGTPPSSEEKVKENITINIAKFADSYNVHTVNLKEGVEEIKEIISQSFEEMLTSVKIAGK